MIKYLKAFFYPEVVTYSYNKPKELVLARIEEIFKNKVTLFSFKDMSGSFITEDSFIIDVVSPASTGGIKYSSQLVGQVIETAKDITEIKTKAKPAFSLYVLFFGTIIAGLILLCKFIQTGLPGSLLWSLAMLIAGPAFSVGFSNVAITAIRERYIMYIHNELKGKQHFITSIKDSENV